MNRWINLLLWTTTIVWLYIWNAWMFQGKELFEVGQAFTIFGFVLASYLTYPKVLITKIALTIATNQLLDELIFNPFKISWNEYFTIGALILLILAKSYGYINTKKK